MLIRFRDGSGFPSPFNMFDDFFGRDFTSFFGRDLSEMLQRNQGVAMPAVNIRETENSFQIELAAPGLRKEDFRVNVEHNMLTIIAQQEMRSEESPAQSGNQGQSMASDTMGGQATGQMQSENTTGGSTGGSTGSSTTGATAGPQSTGTQGATAGSGQVAAQGQSAMATQSQGSMQPHRYTRREFSYSSFQRSFTLPESVDPERISANYQNGILTVDVPKREQQQSRLRRNIDIS